MMSGTSSSNSLHVWKEPLNYHHKQTTFPRKSPSGSSQVRKLLSMNPSLQGWYGVVLVLCMPKRQHTLATTCDPKFVHWLLCSSQNAPYLATIMNTSFWSGNGKHSSRLEKWQPIIRENQFPAEVTGYGPATSMVSRSIRTPTSYLCNGSRHPRLILGGAKSHSRQAHFTSACMPGQ